jgi:hypothetical protein
MGSINKLLTVTDEIMDLAAILARTTSDVIGS